MGSSCEKNAVSSQIENVVIRKVFFLLKILVFGPVLHCCQVFSLINTLGHESLRNYCTVPCSVDLDKLIRSIPRKGNFRCVKCASS